MDLEKLKKGKIEILESLRFWLSVLRKFNGFTGIQKGKLDIAYKEINEVYENFEQGKVLDRLLAEDQLKIKIKRW